MPLGIKGFGHGPGGPLLAKSDIKCLEYGPLYWGVVKREH